MTYEENGKKYNTVTFDRVLLLLRENNSRTAKRIKWMTGKIQYPYLGDLKEEDLLATDWVVYDKE